MTARNRDAVPIIGTNRSKSMDRGLRILQAFSRAAPEHGVRELARTLGLNKSIVHRLVRTLADQRFLEFNLTTGKYRIGPVAFEVGQLYVTTTALHEAALPSLRALANEHKLNAAIAVLRGPEVIHLITLQSSAAIVLRASPGSRSPAHSTAVGKVMLAAEPEDRLDEILGAGPLPVLTPRTITDTQRLKVELAEIRRRGYSIADEENYPGVFAVGAPVRERSGEVVAALSGACPRYLVTEDRIPGIVAAVVAAAGEASRKLGAPGEPNSFSASASARMGRRARSSNERSQ